LDDGLVGEVGEVVSIGVKFEVEVVVLIAKSMLAASVMV